MFLRIGVISLSVKVVQKNVSWSKSGLNKPHIDLNLSQDYAF